MNSGDVTKSLIDIISKGNFRELIILMERIDNSTRELQNDSHPESGKYIEVYSAFRIEICVQLKSLISRTLEQLTSQTANNLQQVQKRIYESQLRQDRIRHMLAVTKNQEKCSNSVLDIDGEDLNANRFGVISDSSYLPVGLIYKKFRKLSQNISLITSFLKERSTLVPHFSIYKE